MPPPIVEVHLGDYSSPRSASLKSTRWLRALGRVALGLVALWLFLLALATLRDGAAQLAPQLRGSTLTDSVASSLGFAWVTAMAVMSGSPVAVGALALMDAGTVSARETFSMLVGSRIGASCVVLLVASVYALAGKSLPGGRRGPIGIGLLAVMLTFVAYVPGSLFGYWLLDQGALSSVRPSLPASALDFIALSTDPVVSAIDALVPHGWLIACGALLILASVRLIDKALPEIAPERLAGVEPWQNNKWFMLGVGGLVALVTMSVSVALTLLVPAVAKGYLRREHAVAYILGANVTTLGDTLLSALLLGNPLAGQVVIAELIGVGLITIALVAVAFCPLQSGCLRLSDWLLDKPVRMVPVTAFLLLSPVALILIG